MYFLLYSVNPPQDLRKILIAKRRLTKENQQKSRRFVIPALWTFQAHNEAYVKHNQLSAYVIPALSFYLPGLPKTLEHPSDFLNFIKLQFQHLVTTAYWQPVPDVVNTENSIFRTPNQLLLAPPTDIYLCFPKDTPYYSLTKTVCPPINKQKCPATYRNFLIKLHALSGLIREALHHNEQMIVHTRLMEANFHLVCNNFFLSMPLNPPMHSIAWTGIYTGLYRNQTALQTLYDGNRTNFQSYYNVYLEKCCPPEFQLNHITPETRTVPMSQSSSSSSSSSLDSAPQLNLKTLWKEMCSLKNAIHKNQQHSKKKNKKYTPVLRKTSK